MKLSVEMKDNKIYYEMEIGEDTVSGNVKVNTSNYFLLADLVSRFNEYKNQEVKDFKDSVMTKFIKEELSKRSKE